MKLLGAILLVSLTQLAFSSEKQEHINKEKSIGDKVNDAFVPAVAFMDKVFFWDPFAAMHLYDPLLYDEDNNPVYDAQGKQKK